MPKAHIMLFVILHSLSECKCERVSLLVQCRVYRTVIAFCGHFVIDNWKISRNESPTAFSSADSHCERALLVSEGPMVGGGGCCRASSGAAPPADSVDNDRFGSGKWVSPRIKYSISYVNGVSLCRNKHLNKKDLRCYSTLVIVFHRGGKEIKKRMRDKRKQTEHTVLCLYLENGLCCWSYYCIPHWLYRLYRLPPDHLLAMMTFRFPLPFAASFVWPNQVS